MEGTRLGQKQSLKDSCSSYRNSPDIISGGSSRPEIRRLFRTFALQGPNTHDLQRTSVWRQTHARRLPTNPPQRIRTGLKWTYSALFRSLPIWSPCLPGLQTPHAKSSDLRLWIFRQYFADYKTRPSFSMNHRPTPAFAHSFHSNIPH